MVKVNIHAMAFSRDLWIRSVRNRLVGPLKEYTKEKMAPLVPLDFSWDNEINRLMKKVVELFDPKMTKLKSKFNIPKAFAEAVNEVGGEQVKIREAIDAYITRYLSNKTPSQILEFEKKVSDLNLDAADLVIELIDKYTPELIDVLQKGME